MTSAEARHAGLFIGGHVRDGISVANCIAAGASASPNAAARYLCRGKTAGCARLFPANGASAPFSLGNPARRTPVPEPGSLFP